MKLLKASILKKEGNILNCINPSIFIKQFCSIYSDLRNWLKIFFFYNRRWQQIEETNLQVPNK